MEYFSALRDIEKQFPGLNSDDLRRAFDTEVFTVEHEPKRKMPYAQAVEITHDRILGWLKSADEYRGVALDWAKLAHFVTSHRPACVWAVLAAEALKAKGKI